MAEGLPRRMAKCQRGEEEGTHVQTRLGPSQPPAWVKVLGASVGTRTPPERAAWEPPLPLQQGQMRCPQPS